MAVHVDGDFLVLVGRRDPGLAHPGLRGPRPGRRADPRARRRLRPVRHEHARRTPAGLRGLPGGPARSGPRRAHLSARRGPSIVAVATLSNTHPALRRAWHPICRSSDLGRRRGHCACSARPGFSGATPTAWRTPSSIVVRTASRRCRSARARARRCAAPTTGGSSTTEGRCVEIPALGPDATIPPGPASRAPGGLDESHGMVFLAPEEPLTPRAVASPRPTTRAFVRGDLDGDRRRAPARGCSRTTSSTWRTSPSCTPPPSAPTRRARCRALRVDARGLHLRRRPTSTTSPTARTPASPRDVAPSSSVGA